MRAIIFFGACLLAQPWTADAENTKAWTFSLEEPVPESGTVTRHFIVTEHHRFSFIAPRDWRVHVDAPRQKAEIRGPGLEGVSMTIQWRVGANPSPTVDWEQWRRNMIGQYATASIVRETPAATGSGQGRCLDLLWPAANGARLAGSVALVTSPVDTVEFTLFTAQQYFREQRARFTALLNSVRTETLQLTPKAQASAPPANGGISGPATNRQWAHPKMIERTLRRESPFGSTP